MSIFVVTNLLFGSLSGIASYKEKPLDTITYATYASIITPITAARAYYITSITDKIKYSRNLLPGCIIASVLVNSAVVGLGHQLGKSAYKALE